MGGHPKGMHSFRCRPEKVCATRGEQGGWGNRGTPYLFFASFRLSAGPRGNEGVVEHGFESRREILAGGFAPEPCRARSEASGHRTGTRPSTQEIAMMSSDFPGQDSLPAGFLRTVSCIWLMGPCRVPPFPGFPWRTHTPGIHRIHCQPGSSRSSSRWADRHP